MLKLDSQDLVGLTAYFEDDLDPLQWYALPIEPTLAVRDGQPVINFVKYRSPIDRAGGVKAGGFLVMQIELALSGKDEAEIRRRISERLRSRGLPASQANNVKLGRPTFTRGAVHINLMDGDSNNPAASTMVQSLRVPSPPSLFGNNSVSLAVELSDFGAAVFEGSMRGTGASLVVVAYSLGFSAKLPAANLVGTWHAENVMHFFQDIQEHSHWYRDDDYEEKITDEMHKTEVKKIEWITPMMPFGDPATFQKAVASVEDSVTRAVDEGIKRNILEAIPPENRDVSKIRERGFEDIQRTVDVSRIADVRVEYKAASIIEMPANSNAPLPAIGSIKVNGKNLKWEDYVHVVDGDDPFFKQIGAFFTINADFDDLPLSSVIVQVDYKGKVGTGRSESYTFRKNGETQRFEAFLDEGTGEFTYSYIVNYKGESDVYRSPVQKSKGDVSINVGDLGIWKLDIDVGDINFDQVAQAQLKVVYDDGAHQFEKQFTISKTSPKHQVREVIFKPRDKPWHFQVRYFLAGGREIVTPMQEGTGDQLYVNDPFSASRTVNIRTKGDFDHKIDTLFLDFSYEDPDNDYQQSESFAFSASGKRFTTWSIPVISEKSGKLHYTGTVLYKDGTPTRTIPDTAVTGATVLEGEDVEVLDQLKVEILADLIDWSVVKLGTIKLTYTDPAHSLLEDDTFTLKQGMQNPVWTIPIKDKTLRAYQVTMRLFMKDGSKKEPPPFTSSDETLVIEIPA